jgi:hypothetical protein
LAGRDPQIKLHAGGGALGGEVAAEHDIEAGLACCVIWIGKNILGRREGKAPCVHTNTHARTHACRTYSEEGKGRRHAFIRTHMHAHTHARTGFGVGGGLQPDVVDVRVRVVVAGARDGDVELAREVGPLRVAQVLVGDHVVDVLAVVWCGMGR